MIGRHVCYRIAITALAGIAAWTCAAVTVAASNSGATLPSTGAATSSVAAKTTVLAYAETAATIDITVSDLAINPRQPAVGETVTVSAIVRNAGDMEGSQKVSCRVNGEIIGEKIVTVPAGGSAPVSFTLKESAAGAYNVDINGLTGSFTIIDGGASLLGWFRWLVVSVIVLSIAGIAVLGFVVLRRARRAGPGPSVK